jgi:uroporphyrinogen III methyltransferase/synthase
MVYLVGAGPGAPGLITVAGRDALAQADCVVYDKLVDTRLLDYAPAAAERIYVGKESGAGAHCTPQASINVILVEKSSQGRRVVRLKGGDPLLFGRGGEEAEALAAAGSPYAIIPGVTAAVAAAATAGLPLTHRGDASAVAFVTGHEDPEKSGELDWQALARFPGTLVVYMPLARRRAIAQTLIAHGKDGVTPTTFIEWAGTNKQRVVETSLEDVANQTEDAAYSLQSPTLAIIGAVCRRRDRLKWLETLPLFGVRVLVLRPPGQSAEIVQKLEALGAQTICEPVFRIELPSDWTDVDLAIARLKEFSWIAFTSRNGVESFLDRIWSLGLDGRALHSCRIAAIGPGTAAALETRRIRADLIPPTFRSEELAASLAPHARDHSVLLVRANRGRPVLAEELCAAGARVETVVAYNQVDSATPSDAVLGDLRNGRIGWVLFSSPTMAEGFFRWLDESLEETVRRTVRFASISPVTTAKIVESGFDVHAEAVVYTIDGLVDATARAVTSSSS